jgi:salicylate hydroxylase
VLLRAVQQESGTGPPCKLVLNRRVVDASPEIGQVTFENGETITADVVIGADGGGSRIRATIGIVPDAKRSARCCYRSIIASQKLRDLGLDEFINSRAIEFWATKDHKIVAGCAHGFEIFAMYCFYP